MKRATIRMSGMITACIMGCAAERTSFAGQAQKWEDVPEAVRATVLANGGKQGSVDKEGNKIDGKAVYEASVTRNGVVLDLVITEDGKLVETKDDDAADKAKEQAAKGILNGVKFSHPRDITNPYLPLASLKQDILEGTEDGKAVHIERTAKPEVHKSFRIAGQKVQALAVEDRETENGEPAEVAMDYFAQDDNGTVYYLGEKVDEYKDGKVISHEGSWMLGKDTEVPGVILPGNPKVGDKFSSEDVSKEIHETDEVVSVSETVKAGTGTYENCVKVKENLADGTTEYKLYARGIGVVKEGSATADVPLKSHTTVEAAAK